MNHPPTCRGCRALICVPSVVGAGLLVDWAFIRRGHLAASQHAGLHRVATAVALVTAGVHLYFSDIRRLLNHQRSSQ